MKKLPKAVSVSIVIPVYNEQDYIKQCLDSIKNQTVAPDEVIVVDNNSTDDTIKIAKTYSFVTVVNEKKQGVHNGRTKGFNEASSDVILKLDADTRINRTWVKRVKYEFEQNNIGALTSYVGFYDGYMDLFGKDVTHFVRSIGTPVFNTFTFRINRIFGGGPMLYGANYAVRKNIWNKIKANSRYDLQIWEDLDTALLVRSQGEKIKVIKQKCVEVSSRSGLISNREFAWRMIGWVKTYWPYKKFSAFLVIWSGLLASITIAIVMMPIRLNKK